MKEFLFKMAYQNQIDIEDIRLKQSKFRETAEKFFNGEINMKEYKHFSGKYGTYSQRGGKNSMLRLRMTAGRLTPAKMRFVVEMAKKHDIDLMHFTTGQTIQLHNLNLDAVCDIMDKALDVGIICYGGGGDYPRNVLCSPRSGVEEEYFDVMPYALAAADFMVGFIDQEKMPRKLKVGFSNSKANESHATFRDLGFVARPDGRFDVYGAGGLGGNPRFGVLLDEAVDPSMILYDIEAMILTFRQNGNYENRTKARTRYMQETLGEQGLVDAFQKNLSELKAAKDLRLELELPKGSQKAPKGEELEESFLVKKQTQPGLYSVLFHPYGGSPRKETMEELLLAIESMEDVEMRLSPDEGSWIINLTAEEAGTILAIIDKEAAKSDFELSTSCIGAAICQVGVRNSQGALAAMIKAVKEAGIAPDALPQINISGCASSCAAHQTGILGFRGGVKVVDRKPINCFVLFVGGNDIQGQEVMAEEVGSIAEDRLPEYMVELGKTVMASGLSFAEWFKQNPQGPQQVAASFLL